MFVKRLVGWVSGWGGATGTASGQQVPVPIEPILNDARTSTVDGALQISTVYACVELLANTISTLPLYVYEETDDGAKIPAKDSRLWALLHDRPNAWMTPVEFLSVMVLNRVLRGNAYAHIVRDGEGAPIALVPLSADQMEVSVVGTGAIYTYFEDGKTSVIHPDNVIHWKGLGNGYMGLSKLEFMRASTSEAINAQENASKLFGKFSKPSGILQTDAKLNDEQLKAVMERFGQMSRSGAGLFVVDRGLRYSQLSLSPADAQLLQTRQFSVEEICRWFGVPSVLVQSNATTTWGSGIGQIVDGFHKFSIRPLCSQLEQAIEKVLIPSDDMKTSVEFKLEGFLRANPQERADFYSKMVQNGAMTRNEVRKLENLPSVDGGDDLTVQSNLIPIDKLGETPEKGGKASESTEPVRQ